MNYSASSAHSAVQKPNRGVSGVPRRADIGNPCSANLEHSAHAILRSLRYGHHFHANRHGHLHFRARGRERPGFGIDAEDDDAVAVLIGD